MDLIRVVRPLYLIRLDKYSKYSTLTTQSFGRLFKPKGKAEKTKYAEIYERIPFDMADSWFERNEILMRTRMQIMPEQFAEASVKYSSNEVDFILNSLLTHCLNNDSKNERQMKVFSSNFERKLEENRLLNNILERIEENFSQINACECGIILKCFNKLEYKNDKLKLKLINKILSRSETFTKHGLISSLNTLVAMINEYRPHDTYDLNECVRLFNSTLSIVMSKLDKFEMNLISQIVNIISRSNLDVNKQLKQISSYIIEKYIDQNDMTSASITAGTSDNTSKGRVSNSSSTDKTSTTTKITNEEKENNENNNIFGENDVYYLTNGFARKNLLNKKLFKYFEKVILQNCNCYNLDSLVSISNSYSKFGNVIDSGYLDLYCKIAEQVISKSAQMNNLHVSVLANAYSRVYLCHEHLFKVLLDNFSIFYSTYTPRQVAMILHSVTKIQYKSNNQHYLFNQAMKDLDLYCWHSLTMLFQSYVKSDYVDETTTKIFCQHLYSRFLKSNNTDMTSTSITAGTSDNTSKGRVSNSSSTDKTSTTTQNKSNKNNEKLEMGNYQSIDNVEQFLESNTNGDGSEYNKITLLSLIYSLVKTNTFYHVQLLQFISNEIYKRIGEYQGDEIVNLVYSYCKIYNYCKKNELEKLMESSVNILNRLVEQIKECEENISSFSIVKMIQSFGEIRFIQSSELLLNVVKKNIGMINNLSYPQINTIINSFSTLGINDIDVMTILNAVKYKKKIK